MVKKSSLLTLFVFIIYWIKSNLFLDPDFGWRLLGGGIYMRSGIPSTDVFSYTMPTFPWVDHAWIQSLLMNFLYTKFGFGATSFMFMLLPILTLMIMARSLKKYMNTSSYYQKVGFIFGGRMFLSKYIGFSLKDLGIFASFPIWLAASAFLSFSGVRVQVVSWLMMAILYYFLFKDGLFTRTKYYLPPLFLIWANLHGSFLSGLLVLAIYVVLKTLREKRLLLSNYLVFILSSLVTIANPYGNGIWREVLSSVTDSKLRNYVLEWMPSFFVFYISIIFLIVVSFMFLLRFRKKYSLEEIGLYLIFLIQAILTRRHLPLWTIFAVPITVKGIYFFWQEVKRNKLSAARFKLVYKYALVFSVTFFVIDGYMAFREALFVREGNYYPKNAVSYLSRNPPQGNIFSEYGYGGYLIWKLPQKKVFIDGRMPSWRWEIPPSGELKSAFDTYTNVIEGKANYGSVFDNYNIQTVLWSKNESNAEDKVVNKVEGYLLRFGWQKNDFNLIEALRNDGWQETYSDDISFILSKPAPK